MRWSTLIAALFSGITAGAQNYVLDADFMKMELIPFEGNPMFETGQAFGFTERYGSSVKTAAVQVSAVDRSTGHIRQRVIDLDGKGSGTMMMERLVAIGQHTYYLVSRHDHEAKRFTLLAIPADTATLDPKDQPIEFGQIPYTNKQEKGAHFLDLDVVLSRDGSKALVVFSAQKSEKEGEQVISAYVLDQDARALMGGMFVLPAKYRTTLLEDRMVDDQGHAYVIISPGRRSMALTGTVQKGELVVYGLTSSGLIERPIELAGDALALTADLLVSDDGVLECLGFATSTEDGPGTTTSIYRMRLSPVLAPLGAPVITELSSKADRAMFFTELRQAANGGYFLVGGATRNDGEIWQEFDIHVVAADKDLRLRWQEVVERDIKSLGFGRTFDATVINGQLLVTFADVMDNLEKRRSGEKPGKIPTRERVNMFAIFNGSGDPKYSLLKKGAWDFTLFGILRDGRLLGTGSKPSGDKKSTVEGCVVLTLAEKEE